MENELLFKIIGAAIEVHKNLGGPGLLQSISKSALCHELKIQGFNVKMQMSVPVVYKGVIIKEPLYIDITVNDLVLMEVKATEKHSTLYENQLLTYLRILKIKLGLLVNFGKSHVKDGITRVVKNF